MPFSRRRVLAAVGATVGLAGCVAYGGDEGEPEGTENRSGADEGADGFPGPGPIESPEQGEESTAPNGPSSPPTFPTEGPLEARLVGSEAEYHFFDRSSIADVGEVQPRYDHHVVGVTLTEERAAAFSEAIQDADLEENHDIYEVVLAVDGEEIRRSPIAPDLAAEWDSGEWERQFVVQSPTEQEAQRLREALV